MLFLVLKVHLPGFFFKLAVRRGCAHGATKAWWTDWSECGSTVDCFDIDGDDLQCGAFHISIGMEEYIQFYFYQHSSGESSVACLI